MMKSSFAMLAATTVLSLSLSFNVWADEYQTADQEQQAATSPADAIERLKAGNARFVTGESFDRDYPAQAEQTSEDGQYPWAVVLSCLDSRSTPEKVFDQGIGDLFVGRVAGNVVSDNMLGSFEFATRVAGAKAIVVMGHTACGAVKGACDGVELGNLTTLLSEIMPAVDGVTTAAGTDRSSANADFVQKVTKLNAQMQVNEILRRSDVIREMVDAGELVVVPAIHDLSTGEVTFY
ncbi:MAG: carbonic anhydrase family protein [Pseudomonadota bacterium]